MITKKEYKIAKRIVKEYEQQLNILAVSGAKRKVCPVCKKTFEKGRIFLLNSFDKLFCNNGRYDLFLDNLAILDLVMKYTKRGTLLKYIVRSFTGSGNIQHDFVLYEALLKAKGMTRQGIRKAIKELRDLLNLSEFRLPDLLDEIRTQLVA